MVPGHPAMDIAWAGSDRRSFPPRRVGRVAGRRQPSEVGEPASGKTEGPYLDAVQASTLVVKSGENMKALIYHGPGRHSWETSPNRS